MDELTHNLPLRRAAKLGTESIIHMPMQIPRSAPENLNHPFLELSAELHCIVSHDGYLREIRGAWERILGWTITELVGTKYADLVHPEDLVKTAHEHASLTSGAPVMGFRNRYRCKNGSYRWIEWRSLPIDSEGMIYAVASDRGDTAQTLTSSLLFEELIQNVHDPVYVLAVEEGAFRMVYANDAAVRHFRLPREKVLQLTIPDFDPDWPLERCRDFVAKLRVDRRAVFETTHLLGDGVLLPVEVSASHIVLGDEELIAGSIRDISERKKVFESIEQHAVELQSVNRELEQLAYIASHDLREPLRTIFSHLELVKRGSEDKLDRTTLDNVDFTIDAAQRLNRLIQDLLSYGSIRKHALRPMNVDMQAVASDVISDLSRRIGETGAKIKLDAMGVIQADHSLMRSLLQNLLTNSLKFTVPGRTPEIHVSVEQDTKAWFLKVTDNGIGIAREDLESVFRMFQRLHAQGDYPGSGIGLAICEKIAKAHGGKIWATSTLMEGSQFIVQIPKDGIEFEK